jgi:hypothetical protein
MSLSFPVVVITGAKQIPSFVKPFFSEYLLTPNKCTLVVVPKFLIYSGVVSDPELSKNLPGLPELGAVQK